MAQVRRLCSGIALAGLLIAQAFAADQTILGQREQVKDPTLGVDLATRKLVGLAKEPLSHNRIVGDPTVGGATVTFFAFGGTPSSQAFALPQGTDPVTGKPLWSAAPTGFKYKDTSGVNGPVKVAQILKSCQGTFTMKVTVVGRNGPITVVPPNPATGGCLLFEINGGDSYHAWLGTGTIGRNDARGFVITNATNEALCAFPPTTTSVPTTTSSSTTTSTSTSTTSTISPCFTDLGNSTIQDSCTGLQWEKKLTVVTGVPALDIHNVNNKYAWAGCCGGTCTGTNYCQPDAASEATCEANTPPALWASAGCTQCASGTCQMVPALGDGAITTVWDWLNQANGFNFAGHNDWRLPSEDGCNSCISQGFYWQCLCGETDLQSILMGLGDRCLQSSCIWPIFGPAPGVAYFYWTGTTDAANPDRGFGVWSGSSPYTASSQKRFGSYVRAVRGDAAPPTTITTSTSTSTTSTSHTTSTHGPTTTAVPTTTSTTIHCFTDPGDGTVKDDCNGLQWEKKTTPVGSGMNPADLHDVDNQYAWAGCCDSSPGACCGNCTTLCQPNKAAQAACRAQTPAAQWASGGCNVCPDGGTCNVDPYNEGAITTVWDWLQQLNAARFAGHSNWRLPVDDGWNGCAGAGCNEQYSLFDDTVPGCNACLVPCIDPIFGPTEDNPAYWSATTAASQTFFGRGYPTDAWEDFFLCGGDQEGSFDYKDWPYNRVRAVRDATGPCADR